MKRVLITGITGQDGYFLSKLLLGKGYKVFGLKRHLSTDSIHSVSFTKDDITYIQGDMCDYKSLRNAVEISRPDEIYNLAAQTNVGTSFSQPSYTLDVNGRGVLYLLEIIKDKGIKFYQAGTSELFGNTPPPHNESSPFNPQSPYGNAKLYAHNTIKLHRDAYGTFASNGILFNHESERRGMGFVTRKITSTVAKIYHGKEKELILGNIESKRDWGYAGDYVEAIYKIMKCDKPDDFVIATGEVHSVREFCELAFNYVGLNYLDFVKTDKKYTRDLDVTYLQGDASKARKVLNWQPKVNFEQLVSIMMENDLKL